MTAVFPRRFVAVVALTIAACLALLPSFARPAEAAPLTGCRNAVSAYVFVRPDGANGLGHVGWGYRVTCTGTWYFGSVENPSGSAWVPAGGDNGFWWQQGTEYQMQSAMRARNYTHYKQARLWSQAVPNPDLATSYAAGSAGRGYSVTGNNCADNTRNVLTAYGVPGLPSLFSWPQPNNWYYQIGFDYDPNVSWSYSDSL